MDEKAFSKKHVKVECIIKQMTIHIEEPATFTKPIIYNASVKETENIKAKYV